MSNLDIITTVGGLCGFAGCVTANEWSAIISAIGAVGCAVIALAKVIKEIINKKKGGE